MNTNDLKYTFSSGLEIKNRMLLAPLTTSSGTESGGLSKSDCDFLLHRSKNFGAIILGSHSISKDGSAFNNSWNIYDPVNFESLKSFVDSCHRQNVKVLLQVYHAGRLAHPDFIFGHQPVAPSRVKAQRSFASFPRELTNSEIDSIIEQFSRAVKNAITIGFDGVELHGANAYLIQQFYSPHSNRRNDTWGGNRSDRIKFPLKVIKACREVINQSANRHFVLGYRFSPEEYETPGIRLEDTCFLLKRITSTSELDYVHLSINNYRKVSLDGIEILIRLHSCIPASIPLIGCGGIQTRADVDEIMKWVPLFSVGNAAIIDPLWASKLNDTTCAIKERLSIKDQKSANIPNALWNMLLSEPTEYFHPKGNDKLLNKRFSAPLPLRE